MWPKNSRLDQINIAYSDFKCDQLVAWKLHPPTHFCNQLEETDTGKCDQLVAKMNPSMQYCDQLEETDTGKARPAGRKNESEYAILRPLAAAS